MNLLSLDSIISTLTSLNYNKVILVAAMTNVDYCETFPEEAKSINSIAPTLISRISNKKGAQVIYLSTDMVFDGFSKTAYQENDFANPISTYGLTKLQGEIGVMSENSENIVLRTSWLFGPSSKSFPNWIIERARQSKNISIPSDKFAAPTYVPDLVSWIGEIILGDRISPQGGIFHLCNTGSCSWQQWGQMCVNIVHDIGIPLVTTKISGAHIREIPELRAKRPLNSILCNNKFSKCYGIIPRPWNDALRHYILNYRDHFY
jgi:dTDP-4-dehydrorhamnose reductase